MRIPKLLFKNIIFYIKPINYKKLKTINLELQGVTKK